MVHSSATPGPDGAADEVPGDEALDEALEETFPASDPSSSWAGADEVGVHQPPSP